MRYVIPCLTALAIGVAPAAAQAPGIGPGGQNRFGGEGLRPGQVRPGGDAGPGELRPGIGAQRRPRMMVRPEQRARLGADVLRLGVRPVPAAQIGARIALGAVVPRRDILRPLPIQIVQFAPDYEGDLFFETETAIVIVDPDTYEIVDVIPF